MNVATYDEATAGERIADQVMEALEQRILQLEQSILAAVREEPKY